MDNAVTLKGLTKQYKEVLAVDSLDLTVRSGEIYGFLGRNGAGKTTTIRMMLGLIKPTGGNAEIFGKKVNSDRSSAVAYAGSLVETATAYPTLTARENLELHRKLRGADKSETDRVLEQLGIREYSNRRAGKLSLGNRQRLALARALIGSPKLLVLDEPANGLDPAGIVEIRKLLLNLAEQQGITVFVSSHILGEVAQLADRIGIIHKGRLIEEFTMADWNENGKPESWRIGTDDNSKAESILKKLTARGTVEKEGEYLLLTDPEADPALMAGEIVRNGIGLRALIPVVEDLESRFLKLTGEE